MYVGNVISQDVTITQVLLFSRTTKVQLKSALITITFENFHEIKIRLINTVTETL